MTRTLSLLLVLALGGGVALGGARSAGSGPGSGTGPFPDHWINGADADEPPIQWHAFNRNTFLLRQSLRTNFEGPFMYLLFGTEKALLLDTGAIGGNPARAVYRLIDGWKRMNGIQDYELVVAHSHDHFDHWWNDADFAARPDTTVVGRSLAEVQAWWGFLNWPEEPVAFDLGDRVVDVIPTPGHTTSDLAFYDRNTDLLLTGDVVYPGRLAIYDAFTGGQWDVYRASIERLVDFTATREVSWILGGHIEMTNNPGEEIPAGSLIHWNEHPLELKRVHLLELHDALERLGSTPTYEVHDDFIIWPIG